MGEAGVSSGNSSGNITVLLGAQWGDEGKGKVIDFLIDHHKIDITARCQGGNNAGHTVVANGRKYDFHLLPSGIISEQCHNIIGNGVVMNLDALFAELEHNGFKDGESWEKRLWISNRCHLVFECHIKADGQQEGLLDAKLKSLGCVIDTAGYLHEARLSGKTILIEGANGTLLDIDFGISYLFTIIFLGTYPYVTSSNSTVGGACTGLGIAPRFLNNVLGVVKAYQTRVGTGPFPTEQLNEIGDKLQSVGQEVGVTTGRKRRCGWLDLVLLRNSNIINGFTSIALTKLDILDDFAEIKVAVAYLIDGVETKNPPAKAADWDRIQVKYETLPGWRANTSKARKFEDLPAECQSYIHFIEKFVGVPIKFIGIGQSREALILR